MVTTAREALDQIDTWLTTEPKDGGLPANEAQDLWDVLAALRGPDESISYAKGTTTAPIRGAAFPKLLGTARDWSETLGVREFYTRQGMSIAPSGDFVEPDTTYTHFGSHVRNAGRALGLVKRYHALVVNNG